MRAFHRSGQTGTLGERDANGFAEFKSDTGAKFTVHQSETRPEHCTAKERSKALELWATWPEGTLRFAVEQGKGDASKAFIVARTHPGRAQGLGDGLRGGEHG